MNDVEVSGSEDGVPAKRLGPLRYNVATIQSDDLPPRDVGEVCN